MNLVNELFKKTVKKSGFEERSLFTFQEFFTIYKQMNALSIKMDQEEFLYEDYERLFKTISIDGERISLIDFEVFFLKGMFGVN